MAQIQVNHLTFYYEGSYEEIFNDVSFSIDTDWKLGFVGRNGRGKTTFLNLLMGKYEYRGSISAPVEFEYFPYEVSDKSRLAMDVVEEIYPDYERWKLLKELKLMEMDEGALYRPFDTLSNGEQTKVMLAVLFLREHRFLLIDEPTNHLDGEARLSVSRYLNKKTGFILVSHDRAFMDQCIDHVLSLNKNTIQVVQGNFTSWWDNKKQRDEFEAQENVKLKREIGRLKEAARQTQRWSEDVEKTKWGTRNGGLKPDRGRVGHKAAKMMKRSKSTENRMEKAASDKEKLLKDVETAERLKIMPLRHHKQVLAAMEDVSLGYPPYPGQQPVPVCSHLSMEIREGERVVLEGRNGSGKSTIIKAILGGEEGPAVISGKVTKASGLIISYVSQDTSWLKGSLSEFGEAHGLDAALFRAILRKLDFSRDHFEKEMEYYSQGQKKKVLLAKSLCEQAHLYIWDEPLNFIDVFSRMQIEELIMTHNLTMILVEHDRAFTEKVAARRIRLSHASTAPYIF